MIKFEVQFNLMEGLLVYCTRLYFFCKLLIKDINAILILKKKHIELIIRSFGRMPITISFLFILLIQLLFLFYSIILLLSLFYLFLNQVKKTHFKFIFETYS